VFGNVQGLILQILWLLFLVVKGFALIDCVRRPAAAFPAVGRQSKVLWLILTAAALLTGLITSPIGLFGVAGIVIAMIYIFDVRTRIIDITSSR